jgi:PAS domain S-box-containing protein
METRGAVRQARSMTNCSSVPGTDHDLRKSVRDLVALSTLSSLWSVYDPHRIAQGLSDVLREMLPLEFIYIRLWNQHGGDPVEFAVNSRGADVLNETRAVGRSFAPQLPFGTVPRTMESPTGGAAVCVAAVPVGRKAESGVIVAASDRQYFPSETERLLLTIAANQTAVIIGREQTAHEGKAERDRWRELLCQAPAAIAVLHGPQHIFELVNLEYEKATGRPESNLVGKPVREALPEVAGQGFVELLDQVYETGLPSLGNERLVMLNRRGDGTLEERFFNFVYQPSKDASGKTTGILVHAVDATEQVIARRRLEDSERQLSTLAASIPQLAWMAEPDGNTFWFNQRWYEYTGTTPEQMLGWGWQAVHDPEMLPSVLKAWRACLRDGTPFEMEFPLRGADNVFRWFLTRVTPLRDAKGEIIRWYGTNTDITELKRIRDERGALLHLEREARATAELLNRVGPTLVSELDLNKLVQSVTDMATILTGAEAGAFLQNLNGENGDTYALYTVSGTLREAFAGFAISEDTEIFAPTFEGEVIVRSDDITQDPRYSKNAPHFGMPEGHLQVKSYLAASVISRSGEVLGGLFFGHSIPGKFTERHGAIVTGIAAQAAIAMDNARLFERAQRSQQALRRSNEELMRANRDLEIFAYSASHDLQEPLRNIALYSQLLKQRYGGAFEGDAAKFVHGILDGAMRMETLVLDLLAYSKATKVLEGPPPIEDAAAILAEVLENLKAQIDDQGAIVASGELPLVRMQGIHLSHLFQNLISNSLKYRGKEIPRIHITAVRQGGRSFVFSVSDNGIGIDPKYRTQVFGLFKRLHDRTKYPGSGVGLAICQRIVEQYGGKIWVDAADGGGSVFRFTIPDETR